MWNTEQLLHSFVFIRIIPNSNVITIINFMILVKTIVPTPLLYVFSFTQTSTFPKIVSDTHEYIKFFLDFLKICCEMTSCISWHCEYSQLFIWSLFIWFHFLEFAIRLGSDLSLFNWTLNIDVLSKVSRTLF